MGIFTARWSNSQSFLEWGGKGAGGSSFSLTIHWLACGTTLHGVTFSVAISTDPIKKKQKTKNNSLSICFEK